MKKIQRILVGVEFSVDGPGERPGPDAELTAGSLQAVREAAWLCQNTGARLTLLHSTWDDEHGEPGPAPAGAVLDRARTAATEAGSEAELLLVEGVHVQIHVVCDSPIRAIEHDVAEHRADLVALGTVARGGIPGFVIGNTAERLLRRIETSVLTVKPADFVCPVEA